MFAFKLFFCQVITDWTHTRVQIFHHLIVSFQFFSELFKMWKQLWSSVIRSEKALCTNSVENDLPLNLLPRPEPVSAFPFWWRETYEKIATKN